ncbi:MAG: hypothetical protein R3B97_07310 [Dehalococcoidia bacterium]
MTFRGTGSVQGSVPAGPNQSTSDIIAVEPTGASLTPETAPGAHVATSGALPLADGRCVAGVGVAAFEEPPEQPANRTTANTMAAYINLIALGVWGVAQDAVHASRAALAARHGSGFPRQRSTIAGHASIIL